MTIDQLAAVVSNGFVALQDEMRAGFQAVNERLDAHDRRFEAVDRRLDGIDTRLDGLEARLFRVERKLDDVIARTDDHGLRLERLEGPRHR
jgi:hypothetical protein